MFDKSTIAMFDTIEDVVADVLARVKELLADSKRLSARKEPENNSGFGFFMYRGDYQFKVVADFTTDNDTEHKLAFGFKIDDWDASYVIRHYQDMYDSYDKMPFVMTDLDKLAKWLVKNLPEISDDDEE